MISPVPALPRSAALAVFLVLAACATAPARDGGATVAPNRQIVILVGLDGLRPASLKEWPEAAPTLNALAERGVRADGLVPVMPSKTFPDFYSIATGLHPDRHGITSNSPYSRTLGRVMRRSDHGESVWWGGEPIWVTAEKQGVRAAAMFWLGSEAEIGGVRPTYWNLYQHDKPFGERTEQVLDWLALPEHERPRFITLYFHAVDSAGHAYGPGSIEERAAIVEVDGELAALVAGVERLGLLDRVNIIVVSDHGMSAVEEGRVIYLDDYVPLDGVFIPEFHGPDGAGFGAAIHLYTDSPDVIYAGLSGAHPALRAYRRAHLPARWRIDHPDRTGDIVVIADPGWVLFARSLTRKYEGRLGGMHGYDRHHPEMLGTFLAAGPRFAAGVKVEAFENVEIYGLIAEILDLAPAETDGDLARVRHLLAPAR